MNQPAFGPKLGSYGYVPKTQPNWVAIAFAIWAFVLAILLYFSWKNTKKSERGEAMAKRQLDEEKQNNTYPKNLG